MNLPTNITPLLDGDWILYMACNAVEYQLVKKWKENGEVGDEPTPSFQETVDVIEWSVKDMMEVLQTNVRPIFFFTGDSNFRIELAKSKVYKAGRNPVKPYHLKNLRSWVELNYEWRCEGNLEADDLMSMYQTRPDELYFDIEKGVSGPTCIVTPDKDLRQVDGWHYTPEGNNYPSFGPKYCDASNSYIEPKDFDKIGKGLIGTGYRFFYSQLITGDTVDNIPGLPRHGPAAALKILAGCDSEWLCYEAVREAYRDVCLMADVYLLEQARLLWMVRKYDDKGKPCMWNPPIEGEDVVRWEEDISRLKDVKGDLDEGC